MITIILRSTMRIKQIYKEMSVEFNYPSKELEKVIKKCYELFPCDNFEFKGNIFKRGHKIQVTTIQNKIIEGEFLGVNSKNIICILTNKYIVSHEIKYISDVKNVEILV